jgi:hypothetical protein
MKNKSPEEIDKLQKKIVDYQDQFYQSCEATFEPFVNFMKKK